MLAMLAILAGADELHTAGMVIFMAGIAGTILPYYSGALRRVHLMFLGTILVYAGACLIIGRLSRQGPVQ
jgi:hypothetical protein